MSGGNTSADFGNDVVAMVKANKAKEVAAHDAKLAAARAAVMAAATETDKAKAAAREAGHAGMWATINASAAADEQREKTLSLFAWQRAGGTAEAFEEAWPEMRRKQIAERVTNGDAMRQQATQQMYRSIF